jgi:hypothetical protein
MSDASTNGNDPAKTQGQAMLTSANTSVPVQQPAQKVGKRAKSPATSSDGLAVAGMFAVIGIFSSYFPIYAHILSFHGLCQFIAYICYGIGFLGGCFELGKLSKNQFFDSFGIGIISALICFGLNWLADVTRSIYALSLIIRILVIVPLAIAAYGTIRGILYLIIKDDTSGKSNQQASNNDIQADQVALKERMKPEQIAGISIAVLSVVTALIQALPSLVPFFKQLLHIP